MFRHLQQVVVMERRTNKELRDEVEQVKSLRKCVFRIKFLHVHFKFAANCNCLIGNYKEGSCIAR